MKHHTKISLICLVLMGLSACTALDNKRQEVQQGNILDASQLQGVSVGMTKAQVRYRLGDPLINNVLSQDRFEYVYSFKKPYSALKVKQLIIYFKDDVVTRVEENYKVLNTK